MIVSSEVTLGVLYPELGLDFVMREVVLRRACSPLCEILELIEGDLDGADIVVIGEPRGALAMVGCVGYLGRKCRERVILIKSVTGK